MRESLEVAPKLVCFHIGPAPGEVGHREQMHFTPGTQGRHRPLRRQLYSEEFLEVTCGIPAVGYDGDGPDAS